MAEGSLQNFQLVLQSVTFLIEGFAIITLLFQPLFSCVNCCGSKVDAGLQGLEFRLDRLNLLPNFFLVQWVSFIHWFVLCLEMLFDRIQKVVGQLLILESTDHVSVNDSGLLLACFRFTAFSFLAIAINERTLAFAAFSFVG